MPPSGGILLPAKMYKDDWDYYQALRFKPLSHDAIRSATYERKLCLYERIDSFLGQYIPVMLKGIIIYWTAHIIIALFGL
jgi:hypothetical protein